MAHRRRKDEWDGTERRAPATVLIVRDDPDACELMARFVERGGYRVITATTEAATTGRMGADLPRAVILDLVSGGAGANLKLLDWIRSHDDRRVRTARVILCATSPKSRTFSFESGADAYLVRPFHVDELMAVLADILERPHEQRARHRRDQLLAAKGR